MDLNQFRNLHAGQQAVIIAGGPSLARTNLEAFPSEYYRLGVSLTYRGVQTIDYHFIGDENIFDQVWKDFQHGHPFRQLFVSKGIYNKYYKLINRKNISYFEGTHGRKEFSTNLEQGVYGGGTSSFLAMQFAYYMGFDPVYVVGLDHNWNYESTRKVGEGSGGDLLEHTKEDNNHFTKDFYPTGMKWFKPKEDKMLASYVLAGLAYREAGKSLLNASLETKVPHTVIPRYYNAELLKDNADKNN